MKTCKLFSVIALCAAVALASCTKNKGEEPTLYTVTVTGGVNGSAVADKTPAEEGATVTLTATADPGCEFVKWSVESGDVTIEDATANPTTFTMPAGDVSVKAEFVVRGVLINGTIWALCNVDAPGTFTANPEDAGMFYQWNRKTGWSSTDPLTSSPAEATWDSTDAEGDEWEAANDPCPAGWRVPTIEEYMALCDSGKTTSEWVENGTNGYRFTDNDSKNSIFLPLAGSRLANGGGIYGVTSNGLYWSATMLSNTAGYDLYFNDNDVYPGAGAIRAAGFSVRCRAE